MNKHLSKTSTAGGVGSIQDGNAPTNNTSEIMDINLSKSYNAQYKITPASLRRNK